MSMGWVMSECPTCNITIDCQLQLEAENKALRELLKDALEDWEHDHFDEDYPYRQEWAEKARAALHEQAE